MLDSLFDAQQKKEFKAVLKKFDALYRAMQDIHERNKANQFADGSHALEHDLAVAAFAHAIGRKYSPSLAETSVTAALMHSYDRHPRSASSPDTYTKSDVRDWVQQYLSVMPQEEQHAVIEAVLAHDKPNKGKVTNAPTTGDILADADKLANMMLYSTIRIGQFSSQKPPVELGNLDKRTDGATYKNFNVALDDIFSRIEWLEDESWFVTREGKEMAKVLGAPLQGYLKTIQEQFQSIGLDMFPEAE